MKYLGLWSPWLRNYFWKICKTLRRPPYILNVRSLIYARFNLKIYYPSSYEREICHYKKANIDLIQQAIRELNWERAFHRKNINEKVYILINTINNVLSNLIPHETITCDDEKPPWFNKNIINLIKDKNIFYKSHTANQNSTDKKEAIKALQNKLTSTIENAKSKYYSKLLKEMSNPETSSKAYGPFWKVLWMVKKSLSFPLYTTMVILLLIFTKK